MQGCVAKCYIPLWLSFIEVKSFPILLLPNHVALFGINRTHDRPAETFVYVVFHSMRIMYVSL